MPTLTGKQQGAINAHLLKHVRVGDELDMWWPLDNVYYQGCIGAIEDDGRHRIDYKDGDVEKVYLRKERWKFRGEAAERVLKALFQKEEDEEDDQQPSRGINENDGDTKTLKPKDTKPVVHDANAAKGKEKRDNKTGVAKLGIIK